MSRNQPETPTDPRVRRTRDRLGDALIGLLLEKPFEAITVQQVLDRAGVGRSTFYLHYRDKHDLLVSDMDEFLERMASQLERGAEASRRVAPVRELFRHAGEQCSLHAALSASGRLADFLDLAQGHFARGIERRLAGQAAARHLTAAQRALLSQAMAGALLALLSWWIERDAPESPESMDETFHAMVWQGVGAAAPSLDFPRTASTTPRSA